MSQDRHNATNEEYCFESLPKNVRQVGETMQGTRFFIEDYVMTFLRKCMGDKKEEGIVLFVGKRGKKEAQNCIFVCPVLFCHPIHCTRPQSHHI